MPPWLPGRDAVTSKCCYYTVRHHHQQWLDTYAGPSREQPQRRRLWLMSNARFRVPCIHPDQAAIKASHWIQRRRLPLTDYSYSVMVCGLL